MKKIVALFLALLFLTGCTAQETAEESTQPQIPALEGTVTIEGEGKEGALLTAKAELSGTAQAPSYQWYLDGKPIPNATADTLPVPSNAGGRAISVGVTTEDRTGQLLSQPVTSEENTAAMKTMAGMFYASKQVGRVFLDSKEPETARMEWPACGFEFRIDAKGGLLKIHYRTSYETTIMVFIDDVAQPRCTLMPISGGSYYQFELTPGEHTVKILRDGEPNTGNNARMQLTGIEFEGKVLDRPEDKKLYMEVIGDSISTGMGSTGVFDPSASVKVSDTAATQSYGYFVAQDLDADYSIVAKGGIGVVQGEGAQNINMMRAYEHTWVWNEDRVQSFSRKPDLIILELGANDSIAHNVSTELYKQEIWKFIQLLRRIHGEEVPIMWLGRQQDNYHGKQLVAVQELIKEHNAPNLYAASFPCGNEGAGGVNGHPNAKNHRDFADLVTNFIRTEIGIGK